MPRIMLVALTKSPEKTLGKFWGISWEILEVNSNQQKLRVYEFGPFRLDGAERTLTREGEPVRLSPKLIETLLVLVERNGHIVEKDELMEAVWPGTFVEESNLSSNVSLLRKALGDGENGKPYIETIPRRGYRFVAEVREWTGDEAALIIRRRTTARITTREELEDAELPDPLSPALLETQAKHSLSISAPETLAVSALMSRQVRVIIVSVLALLLAGTFLFLSISRWSKPPAKASEVRTMAILPFKEIGARMRPARDTWAWAWPMP